VNNLISSALYFLALINPISKIFVLSTLAKDYDARRLRSLSFYSSLVGLGILVSFAVAGSFILDKFFHVDIYSFKAVGGVVLFAIGFKALNKGVFFEVQENASLEEISIVPLASPLIAGPATITAAVSFSFQHEMGLTLAAIGIALTANLLLMLIAAPIARLLTRFNLMGALIRITGLVVATIAAQMVLDGLSEWMRAAGRGGAG
jgi:multiple antibiotic resistance protein